MIGDPTKKEPVLVLPLLRWTRALLVQLAMLLMVLLGLDGWWTLGQMAQL